MADFRIQTSWRTHPKRKKLRRRLGGDGVVAIEDLWAFCAETRQDGSLAGMTDEDIAIACDWEEDPGVLVGALVEVRLLDGTPGNYRVHDWAEHQPHVVEERQRKLQGRANALMGWHAKGHHAGERNPECPLCAGNSIGITGQGTGQPGTTDGGPMGGHMGAHADPTATPNAPSLPPSLLPSDRSNARAREEKPPAPIPVLPEVAQAADVVELARGWHGWSATFDQGKWQETIDRLDLVDRDDVLRAKAEAEAADGVPSAGLLLSILDRYRREPEVKQVRRKERRPVPRARDPAQTETETESADAAEAKRMVSDLAARLTARGSS
jgi:hypothetical protein